MTPEAQLDEFIDRFSPAVAADARAALALVTVHLPGATRLVYDNYNALAIGFGPTDKMRAIICSVALYPRWVSLFLVGGQGLPDPAGLLEGSGATMRHVKLNPERIADPAVAALIDAAAAIARIPIDPAGEPRLLIKSISAKQRPRR